MWDLFYYLVVLGVLGGAAYAGLHFIAPILLGETAPPQLFKNKADRRLQVIEQANVDRRRQLVIVRRDNVEHLIMTGGPVDVVIETGIGQKKIVQQNSVSELPKAVFSRQPRTLGQTSTLEN